MPFPCTPGPSWTWRPSDAQPLLQSGSCIGKTRLRPLSAPRPGGSAKHIEIIVRRTYWVSFAMTLREENHGGRDDCFCRLWGPVRLKREIASYTGATVSLGTVKQFNR